MRELTQLSPIPDSGVFTRIGEERKDEEWGGELPFPYLDVLREKGFEGNSYYHELKLIFFQTLFEWTNTLGVLTLLICG